MSDISDEIKRVFDLASLRIEAVRKLDSDQWATFQKIKKVHDGRRRFVSRMYELEFDKRLAEEQRRQIDKAGEKRLDFVHKWFGQDNFDRSSAIERRALFNVQARHKRDLERIDDQESAELARLIERSDTRKEQREKPLRAFRESTNRRSTERRVRKRA